MLIPNNVILPWIGAHASLPTNWSRETSLDAKFIKAWGTANPADTGGASAHSHTGIEHTHTKTDTHGHVVAYNYDNHAGDDIQGSNRDPHPEPNHAHDTSTITTSAGGSATSTVAYPTSTNNNHPPYYGVIFIKAGSGAVLPDGAIVFWNSETLPSGYLMCYDGSNGAPALGNKYLRGATTGADSGTTGGSLTHQHVLNHSHTTSHTHTGLTGGATNMRTIDNGGSGSWKIGGHNHDVTLNTASVTTDTYTATLTSGDIEPAYKKLIALYKDGGVPMKGIIGIWVGTVGTIPQGWLLCNGQAWSDGVTYTPDLQNYFIKIANATSELGDTGGANTHAHSASNAHTHSQTGTHTHTASIGYVYRGGTQDSTGGTRTPDTHNHTASSVGNNNATLTWGSASMSAESVSNQPDHVVVAFIQLEKVKNLASRIIDA